MVFDTFVSPHLSASSSLTWLCSKFPLPQQCFGADTFGYQLSFLWKKTQKEVFIYGKCGKMYTRYYPRNIVSNNVTAFLLNERNEFQLSFFVCFVYRVNRERPTAQLFIHSRFFQSHSKSVFQRKTPFFKHAELQSRHHTLTTSPTFFKQCRA